MGKMDEIRDLQKKGIVILPDPSFGDPKVINESIGSARRPVWLTD